MPLHRGKHLKPMGRLRRKAPVSVLVDPVNINVQIGRIEQLQKKMPESIGVEDAQLKASLDKLMREFPKNIELRKNFEEGKMASRKVRMKVPHKLMLRKKLQIQSGPKL